MSDEEATARGGVLDRISRNIAIIGSIIAALVGMNTALTTCAAQTAARHHTFRQAVEAEEQYWRNLYTDYLGVFRQGIGPEERSARLFALSVLAEREVPQFAEYSLGIFDGGNARRLANIRLESMKARLGEVLRRPQSSDPVLAAQAQDQDFTAAEGGVRTESDRQRAEATAEVAAPQARTPAVAVTYQPQILARGDPQGWDFDISWCGGGGAQAEAQNYAAGIGAARALSELSANRERLGGEKLGRIRLVMLPEARQGGIYPALGAGLEIRSERIAAEQQIAAAARAAIPNGAAFRLIPSDTRTIWYVSIFTCAAGQPPPGRPPSNSLSPAASRAS